MAIPPGSIRIDYDFSNPACYSGSGSTVFNLAPFPLLKASTNGLFVSQGNSSYFSFSGTNVGGTNLVTEFFNTISNTFTFNIWCQMQGTASDKPIFHYAGPYGLNFRGNTGATGTFNARMVGPGYGPSISSASSNDTWFLFTIWCDATTFKLYRNGVLVSSGAFTGSLPGGQNYISLGGFGLQNNAKCKIARFQYYTAALDDADILQYFNDTKLYFPANRYDFSETQSYPGTGNTVFDMAGSLNLPLSYTPPVFVGAGTSSYFQFDGTQKYIGYDASANITGLGSTFSINLWTQTTGNALYGVPFSAGYVLNLGRGPSFLYPYGSGVMNASFLYNFGSIDSTDNPINTWQMWTYIADGTNATLYRNGINVGTDAQDGAYWADGAFVFGNLYGGTNFYDGKTALLSVYNTAIGSTDVLALYNLQESRFPSPAPPPPYAGSFGGRQFAQGFHSA